MAVVVLALAAAALGLWLRPTSSRRPSNVPPAVGVGPVGFGLVVAIAWQMRSLVLPVAVLQLWLLAILMIRRTRRRREQQQFDSQLVTFVEELSQQLRSGGALASAFLSTLARHPTVEARLESVVAGAVSGVRLEQALDEEASRQTDPGVRLLAASIAVLTANGGPASTSLERLAHTLRDTAAARDEAWAQASQVLASAVVLAALPLVFASGYAAIEPEVVDFYLRTSLGGICLVGMLGFITLGALWIDLLIGSVR